MDAEAPGCVGEILTDYLSDHYGWLINSFRIDMEGEYLPPENDKTSKKNKRKNKDDQLVNSRMINTISKKNFVADKI